MINKGWTLLLIALVAMMTIVACQKSEQLVSPKPRAFPRVDFPVHSYKTWDTSFCEMRMDIPDYSHVERKEKFFEEKVEADCWFDVVFDDFNGVLHCSYFPLNKGREFDRLKDDAFKLVDKHNSKANFIDRFPIEKEDGSIGFLFHIEGPVASAYQFYISDSLNHFLRGSLYFNTKVNVDSMKPVVDFLAQDIKHMVGSLEWKS